MRVRYTAFYPAWPVISIAAGLICALFLFVPAMLPSANGQTSAKVHTPEEVQQLGQRMYRDGLLPSGETMYAVVSGDIDVPGTSFTCISCHMLSGLGSFEGGVTTTPTNGKSLYNPRNPPKGIRSIMSGGMDMGQGKKQDPPQPPPVVRHIPMKALQRLFARVLIHRGGFSTRSCRAT